MRASCNLKTIILLALLSVRCAREGSLSRSLNGFSVVSCRFVIAVNEVGIAGDYAVDCDRGYVAGARRRK